MGTILGHSKVSGVITEAVCANGTFAKLLGEHRLGVRAADLGTENPLFLSELQARDRQGRRPVLSRLAHHFPIADALRVRSVGKAQIAMFYWVG